ncbi:Brain protein I3 [Orchesella cincta]|uniref:Membrane protein BRI3 n=1 Tax=Orchesella cincta TaxID=48709 RepID=A0A1D2M838_ORCCI|nr:Brain protein I3 [Orchesella cincta]
MDKQPLVSDKPPPYPGEPQPSSYHPGMGAPQGQFSNYEQPPPYYNSGFAAPAAGWVPTGQPPPPPNYGSTIVVEPVSVPATQIIIVGGCPSCRVGVLEDSYSCLGILCAILFFPLGVLCCLLCRERRCSNCGAAF